MDITKPEDLLGHAAGTGPLRTRQPLYVDFMPPCNSACPAGENIQAWLSHAQGGNYFDAFQQIIQDNPFPSIMGRICVSACQTACNRNHIDSTVNVHAIERFIGDKAIDEKWQPSFKITQTGKRVLVIGAGPAGLSAAWHLSIMGNTVEIMEAASSAGGLLHYGIPSYRLPRAILEAEIKRVESLGVIIHLNRKVKDVISEKEKGNFDAVFLGIGAQLGKKETMENDKSLPVFEAYSFLREVSEGKLPEMGEKVMIYGGGKLAMYLSRLVKRLGSSATVIYDGDRKLMPAYDFEADDVIAEGIEIRFLRKLVSVNKKTCSLELQQIEKSKIIGTGKFERFEADSIILAMGQEGDTAFLRSIPDILFKEDGTPHLNAQRMTGHEGIFAGGDIISGERSATIAIGHGKKAAKFINAYLKKEFIPKKDKHPTAGYRKLHMWYKTEAPKKEQPRLTPELAVKSFDEVITGISEKEARYESQRCLSCGNCFECDGCFAACPQDAIIKLGPGKRYQFDFNTCTGCGVCEEQCPCHAIEMIPELLKK
jgi:NADPH-dependent glutamate synthase beta subunit-like oxidoreductase